LVELAPRMIFFRLPYHDGPSAREKRCTGFLRRRLQLRKGDRFSAVVHLQGPVLPLADQSLASGGPITSQARFQLQVAALMPDYPIVAEAALGLDAEHFLEFPSGRLASVIILRRSRRNCKSSVVGREIFFFQILVHGCVAVDPFPPQFLDQSDPDASRDCAPLAPWPGAYWRLRSECPASATCVQTA